MSEVAVEEIVLDIPPVEEDREVFVEPEPKEKKVNTLAFLLVSRGCENAFLGEIIQKEGHSARLLAPPQVKTVIPTIVPGNVEEFKPDIVFAESPGAGHLLQNLGENVKVFGGGPIHDQIESNPAWVTVAAAGIRYIVSDVDVGGPCLTLVGVATGEGFATPAFACQSLQKLYPSTGIYTNETCILEKLETDSTLYRETFGRLEPLFASWKYRGFVTLQVQMTDKMEWHTRRIHTTVPEGFMAAFVSGLSKGFWYFLKGMAGYKLRRRITEYDYSGQVSVSVKLTRAPYPYTETDRWYPGNKETGDQQIRYWLNDAACGSVFARSVQDKVYYSQVTPNEDGTLTSTGPHVGYVAHSGESIEENLGILYSTLEAVRGEVYDIQYRNEIAFGFVPFEEKVENWRVKHSG
jgi:hypothetical protein